MGEELDDCEFWLPPQLLTDNDFLMEFKQSGDDNEGNMKGYSNGLSCFGDNSGLSSPGESVVCSTETESDEDEYLTGLTRKMAQSTLDENFHGFEASKKWGVSGSPKSPLCKYGSGRSSFRSGSQESWASGLNQNEGAWDLLCAAAGEVSRLKMAEESSTVFYPSRNGPVVPPVKPGPTPVPPMVNTGPNYGSRANHYQQLQAAWFERLKMQQLMKQQQLQQQINGFYGEGNGGCRDGLESPGGFSMSAWPTLQQSQQQRRQQQLVPPPQARQGTGMRAVFLGNTGIKRECAGTGVFLPRKVGSHAETRKNKPACSSVLLPERVVHALNLNLEPIDAQPQLHSRYNPRFAPDLHDVHYDVAVKYDRGQQKQGGMGFGMSMRPSVPMMMTMNQEVRLPQDWTY